MSRACSTNEEELECIYGLGGKSRRKETTKKKQAYGRIILRGVLDKYEGIVWARFIWLRIGTSGGLL
jgi:hypothetical protein